MSIKVKELAFVSHTVADIGKARDFYEKLLGLKHLMNLEFAPGVWWVEYDLAGVALEVEDLDESLATIKAAGIPLAFDTMDFPPCRIFGITSPDGYMVMFHQRKA
jgi:predicted enzyme related to lactoylglutathione lyase